MKKTLMMFALALFACAGCRQKDVRDFTVDVPALVQEKEAEVSGALRAALVMCSGVDMASRRPATPRTA